MKNVFYVIFIRLKEILNLLFKTLKQRILESYRKKWERLGFKYFNLNYVIYGNDIYETKLEKYSDGSIHTLDSYKTLIGK